MMFGSTLFLTATLALGAFGLISFKDRGGNHAIWHVPYLQVNDTIITFPGTYSVNLTASTSATVRHSDNVTVSTRITKQNGLFGQDISIPCTDTYPGTCTYDNICDILDQHIDSNLATLIRSVLSNDLGIDPTCPFNAVSFSDWNRVVKLPALSTLDAQLSKLLGPFINGKWEFEFKMVNPQNDVLAWLVATVDLRDGSGSSSSLGSIIGALGRK